MTGWEVVALDLVFVYACMNVCTELMMLNSRCIIGSCLARILVIFVEGRQVNVVVVFTTFLTCYLFYWYLFHPKLAFILIFLCYFTMYIDIVDI